MSLSIIIPVFNEKATIGEIISRVERVQLEGIELKEIIIVDDGSTDGTREVLDQYKDDSGITVFLQPYNKGKGAAVRKGFELATGDIWLVQDSDLEYNPRDYPKLLAPILENNADVVYGSRFVGGGANRVLFYWHSWGNKVLTTLSNMFTNLNLTDMECGYKVFRKEIINQIKLRENRFGFEPEVTAKIGKLAKKHKCRIFEVGISYFGRTYEEGKKINWKDGLSALRCIIKYNLLKN
jgi:glycosyltransferase involved in cell wall biosynthesis